jgi:hypothetical protein
MDTTRGVRPSARSVTGLLVGLMLLLGLLGGCTGSSSKATSTPTTGTAVTPTLPPAPVIKNDPVARKDVHSDRCVATSSGWKASGTVANSKAKASTYTIVISFTTKESTVLARGTTKVTVNGGATKSWTASASFARTKGVVCVLRGVSEG